MSSQPLRTPRQLGAADPPAQEGPGAAETHAAAYPGIDLRKHGGVAHLGRQTLNTDAGVRSITPNTGYYGVFMGLRNWRLGGYYNSQQEGYYFSKKCLVICPDFHIHFWGGCPSCG